MRFTHRLILAAAAAFAALPAHALVIDDFEDGTLFFATPGSGVVDGAGIVGGERDMSGGGSFAVTGFFSSNLGGNGLLVMEQRIPAFEPPHSFNAVYDGNDDNPAALPFVADLNKVDLTDGGASDAIRIRVVENSTEMRLDVTLGEQKPANQGSQTETTFAGYSLVVPVVLAPTDFYLLFADFANPGCNSLFCVDTSPLDFTQVDYIGLEFFRTLIPSAPAFDTMSVEIVDTASVPVPEPSTGLLLTAAILILGHCLPRVGRRSRAGHRGSAQ
ncbi:MAG: hypothetical protein KJ025_15735 [Burkholderiales bacterium]|nr:hypothetical protein [Burkholderiales bacterium]